MSAMSELKTVVSMRDNMSAGLKAIQKEQLRIKKEIQETKEVLKDAFGKKWSIKLQSIELLRHIQEIGKEIGLLRKQLARMLQGIEEKETSASVPIIVKSTVEGQKKERHLVETHTIEKLTVEKNTVVYKSSEKGGNKYDIKTPSGESPESKLVGDVVNNVVSKAAYELFDKAAEDGIRLVGKIGSSLIGMAASEEIKYIMKDLNELEMTGAVAEQQDLYMERAITKSDPSKGIDEVKKQRNEYMKLLRTNSEEAGFKLIEVLSVGDTAVKIAGGDINKAIELVRVAEDMAASNPGSTLVEAMEAMATAKNGDMEGLKSFGAQVSYEELGNIGFEGIVQQKLKSQFAGGVETHMNTLDGLRTAENAYRENRRQESGRVLLNNKLEKERKEIENIKKAREYRKMDVNQKVEQFKDIDTQHKRLPVRQPVATQSKKQAISHGNNTEVNSPNVHNQAFTININGVNRSTNEIMNEMMPKLRLALANASSGSSGKVRFGGAQA